MPKLTKPAHARRYLQASMSAGYTGLPAEHRQAAEDRMRSHERSYPGVRRHALAGSRRHFDEPLSAGERSHQSHLRREEGLGEGEVLDLQRELDTPARARPPRAAGRERSRSSTFTGPRAARSAAAAGGGVISQVTGGGGGVMYFIGGLLLLSLIYLLVAGKGVKVVTGLTNVVTGAVHTFVAPVDPIAAAERALGATPITQPSVSASSSSSAPSTEVTGVTGAVSAPAVTGAVLAPGVTGAAAAKQGAAAPPPRSFPHAALTAASLRREIRAHRLTRAQVSADLKILYGTG